jgi:hypothetical protein
VQPVPEEETRRQQTAFAALLQNLGQASFGEIQQMLGGRKRAKAEIGLTPGTVRVLKSRIAKQSPAA